MKIAEKLKAKQDIYNQPPVTIAFLGDSVTQGCFECYTKSETAVETVFDYKSAYSTRVRELLNILYPNVQVNIINSGISGDNAKNGLSRMERDIFAYSPDLAVVSYGLNDAACGGADGVATYAETVGKIFAALKEKGIEGIFLTQNFMCTHTSPHLKEDIFKRLAVSFAKVQNEGVLKAYYEAAKAAVAAQGGKICDIYAAWEKMNAYGVDTTELLANKLNHPLRELHYYTAVKIIETMFE